jgi:hypothetical protein
LPHPFADELVPTTPKKGNYRIVFLSSQHSLSKSEGHSTRHPNIFSHGNKTDSVVGGTSKLAATSLAPLQEELAPSSTGNEQARNLV